MMMTATQGTIGDIMKREAGRRITGEGHTAYALEFIDCKLQDPLRFGELTILHYEMLGGRDPGIAQAAAAVELLILALDIIDDLQDQDQVSSPWCRVDSAISLNIANGFLSLSIRLLSEMPFGVNERMRAIGCWGEQFNYAVNGQYLDLTNSAADESSCIAAIRQKSGALMAFACLVGAVLAGSPHEQVINEYAVLMGIAAQLENDYRDVHRWDEKNDLVNRKKTLPVIFMLEQEGPEAEWIGAYYEERITRDEFLTRKTEIRAYLDSSGASDYTRIMMHVYRLEALKEMEKLELTPVWAGRLRSYVAG
jgi:competence protein ComQ